MQKVFNIYAKNNVEISINITCQNITSVSILNSIENRLPQYERDNITFEIVETDKIRDYKKIEDFILMVKKYNVKVSIDTWKRILK